MKLIIDIPDEVLESKHYCRYFGAWSTKLTEIIENGTPYEERPQGEWIVVKSPLSNETIVKCDKCGDEFIGNDVQDYNFCPNCGADMRGTEE